MYLSMHVCMFGCVCVRARKYSRTQIAFNGVCAAQHNAQLPTSERATQITTNTPLY